MRRFIDKERTGWSYGEKEVLEVGTEKSYTLTQPKNIFNEDSYHVRRAIAVSHDTDNQNSQDDTFYAYEVAYMPDGYSLCVVTIDEASAEKLISGNIQAFMRGAAREYIKTFFEMEGK